MSTPGAKPSPVARGAKGKQNQKTVIILKLDSAQLSKFPHEKPAKAESTKASTPSTPSGKDSPVVLPEAQSEAKMETPNGASPASLQVPADARKKGGAKAGVKRPLSALADGQAKGRAKPGPKRRKMYVLLSPAPTSSLHVS
jgi:hypothetical protein